MPDSLFDRQLDARPPADLPADWEDSASIEVRRRRELFARGRGFEVFLDDEPVTPLGRAGTDPAVYRVQPGWHAISAKMDWCRTEVVAMHLRPGERAVFVCGMAAPVARWWNRYLLVFFAFMGISLPAPVLEWVPGWKGGWGASAHTCLMMVVFAAAAVSFVVFALRTMMPWKPPGSLFALERLEEECDGDAPATRGRIPQHEGR